MHRIGIVQQRRSEHSCGVNGEPKESNDQQRTTLTQMECGGRLQGRNVGTGMALPYRYRRAHARFRKKFIIRVLCQVSELEHFRLWAASLPGVAPVEFQECSTWNMTPIWTIKPSLGVPPPTTTQWSNLGEMQTSDMAATFVCRKPSLLKGRNCLLSLGGSLTVSSTSP